MTKERYEITFDEQVVQRSASSQQLANLASAIDQPQDSALIESYQSIKMAVCSSLS